MKPLRRVRLELLVLAEIAIAAFCVSQRSIGMFLLAGGLAALSWYVTQGPRGRTLPRWAATALTILILAESGWTWILNPDPSEAMSILGRFAMWLSVLKLYESRSARDDAQLLALSAVLVVAGALHTVDLLFAVLLLVYGIGTIRVAMLLQLVSVEREGTTDGGAPVSGRRFPSQLRRTVVLTAVGSMLVAVMVFVVFPRGSRRILAGAASRARRSRASSRRSISSPASGSARAVARSSASAGSTAPANRCASRSRCSCADR